MARLAAAVAVWAAALRETLRPVRLPPFRHRRTASSSLVASQSALPGEFLSLRWGCQPPTLERPDHIARQAQLPAFVAHGLFSFIPLTRSTLALIPVCEDFSCALTACSPRRWPYGRRWRSSANSCGRTDNALATLLWLGSPTCATGSLCGLASLCWASNLAR
jgi:hypothetical protein